MARLITEIKKERTFTIELNEEELNFLTALTTLDASKLEILIKDRLFAYSNKTETLKSLQNDILFKLFSFFANTLRYNI